MDTVKELDMDSSKIKLGGISNKRAFKPAYGKAGKVKCHYSRETHEILVRAKRENRYKE